MKDLAYLGLTLIFFSPSGVLRRPPVSSLQFNKNQFLLTELQRIFWTSSR